VAVLGVGVVGCADDGPGAGAAPTVVAVETQRCAQPNRFHGVGVVVDDDLVLTAGHVVEGELRDLRVDGEPAVVVALDRRTDLALLGTELPDTAPAVLTGEIPGSARLLTAAGGRDVDIDRHVTLVVEHATDRATYRRDVVFFTPGVVDGESGSPLVDDAQRLVGVVIADQDGEGLAVTAAEIVTLLGETAAANDLTWPDPSNKC
jgi:S1-C subfamily serine protease